MACRQSLNQQLPVGCAVMGQAVAYGEILSPFPAPRPAAQHGQMHSRYSRVSLLCSEIPSTALQHQKQQEILDFFISAKEKDKCCQGGISPSSLRSLRSPISFLPSLDSPEQPFLQHPTQNSLPSREETVLSSWYRKNIPHPREFSFSQLDFPPNLDKKVCFPTNPTENSVLDYLEIHWGCLLARHHTGAGLLSLSVCPLWRRAGCRNSSTPLSRLQNLFCPSTRPTQYCSRHDTVTSRSPSWREHCWSERCLEEKKLEERG